HNKILSNEIVNKLNRMDKLKKNILVGKFLRDNPNVNSFLMEEFIRIRKELFEINNIEVDDVLSIKKDAIFIVNKRLRNLNLNDDYKFQEKNKYTSYINIAGKEF